MLVSVAGMGVLLCGGLVVIMRYAKVQIRQREAETVKIPPPAAAEPYAEKIAALDRSVLAVVRGSRDDAAFLGRYVREDAPGLYLDILSDEVLFSSVDKLEPERGYAEFSKPFAPDAVVAEEGIDGGEVRVRSKKANTTLGWVVPEQQQPEGGRRYVINSSVLRFVPAAELEKNGLGAHRVLFPVDAAEPSAAPAPEAEAEAESGPAPRLPQ